ncbi:MAG: hypothetical protein HQK57_02435 [Deltaproteobacteria bacterium]|nr:hypothetical protein [Deltaproteobacteria bacterium]
MTRSWVSKIPLTPKMLFITLSVGIILWGVQDVVLTKTLKDISHAQLTEMLHTQAHEDRIRFDGYVAGYRQTLKLIVSQKSFLDHVLHDDFSLDGDAPVMHRHEIPLWLPDAAIMRKLVHIHYALLIDGKGRIKEIYQGWPDQPPQSLLHPSVRLIRISDEQSILTSLDGAPFLVASESVKDQTGRMVARLIIATRLNDNFVDASQGSRTSQRIVALVAGEYPKIVASNKPDNLPVGMPLDEVKKSYLIIGKSFFDGSGSELTMQFTSLMSKSEFVKMTDTIVKTERFQRTILFFLFVLSFAGIMFWITRHIQQLTRQIISFSKDFLNIQPQDVPKGDQLVILEQQFSKFKDELSSTIRGLNETRGQLAINAHQAGMAEIAVSVLHNIGNVINSINVKIYQLEQIVKVREVQSLEKVYSLMQSPEIVPEENEPMRARKDKLMRLLSTSIKICRQKNDEFEANLESARKGLDHVMEIIAIQQKYAGLKGFETKVDLNDLLDDSLEILADFIAKRGIRVELYLKQLPTVLLDKNKMVQLLINVIKNAYEAIDMAPPENEKRISISDLVMESDGEDFIQVVISDTGVGFLPDNKEHLFRFNYSTKGKGTGFGLHASANYIKAQGGSMEILSDGLGKGARMIIKLPVSTGAGHE